MLKLWTLYILILKTVWKSHKVSLLPTPASPDLMSDVYVIYLGTAAAAWPNSAHTGHGSVWRLSATWADEQIKLYVSEQQQKLYVHNMYLLISELPSMQ